jgi:hypothetical protein
MTRRPPLRVECDPLTDEQAHALLSQPAVIYWLAEAIRDLRAATSAETVVDAAVTPDAA